MALEGTIRDFALPDIFQLIGIQRKTGILTLKQAEDTVTIKFLDGHVVEVDTVSNSLEDRLGEVLVRTGRIAQQQLDRAIAIQRETLQRLGHVLVKQDFISQDELVDALQIQSSQIVYRLFRWREGSYHFDPVEKLDYDQIHSTPISAESILMEGARMVDEWPIIERRIPNDQIVFRKTALAETVELEPEPPGSATAGADDIDLDLGFDLDLARSPDEADATAPGERDATRKQEEIQLSPEERLVLALIDGKRTVREITDLLTLPEFETFRALSDMVTRKLVERVPEKKTRRGKDRRHGIVPKVVGALVKVALLSIVVVTVWGIPSNPITPWRLLDRSATAERLRLYTAMARLERIEAAVQVYYLDAGTFPSSLALLVQRGYLDTTALLDPWGRPYQYALSGGGYQIAGLGGDGDPLPGLTVARGFSEAQRLLLEPDPAASP